MSIPKHDFHLRLTAALALIAGCTSGPTTGDKSNPDDHADTDVAADTDRVDTDIAADSGDTSEIEDTATDVDTDTVDTDVAVDTHETGDTGVVQPTTQPNANDLALLATCANPVVGWMPTWPGGHLIEVTDCLVVAAGDPCPDYTAPLPWSPESPGNGCATDGTTCVTGFVGRNDIVNDTAFWDSAVPDSVAVDACCYTYVGPQPSYACGRPWMIDGVNSAAPCVAGEGWAKPVSIALPRNPADREAALARWVADARAEHASVAAFARLTLDLLAHAAPASLITDVSAAMMDEVRHATDAFAIASALAGEPLTAGPLPLRTDATPTLVELAVATALEGGVGETIAAATAAARLAVATDPTVRAALARVVEEETAHAALAWRIVDWAIAQGGEAVRDAVDAAVAEKVASLPMPDEERIVASHGLCGADALRAAHAAVFADVYGLAIAA